MVRDVGRILGFSTIEVGCGFSRLLFGASCFDVAFLRCDVRKLGSNFDRAVG